MSRIYRQCRCRTRHSERYFRRKDRCFGKDVHIITHSPHSDMVSAESIQPAIRACTVPLRGCSPVASLPDGRRAGPWILTHKPSVWRAGNSKNTLVIYYGQINTIYCRDQTVNQDIVYTNYALLDIIVSYHMIYEILLRRGSLVRSVF